MTQSANKKGKRKEKPDKTDAYIEAELARVKEEEVIEEKPKELTAIEKVQIMHALTSAVHDPKVKDILQSREMGEQVFDLFVNAVEKTVGQMMSGTEDEAEAVRLNGAANNLVKSSEDLHALITNFLKTPLVNVLSIMNQKLAAKGLSQPQQQDRMTEDDPSLRDQRIREMQEQERIDRQQRGNGVSDRQGRGPGVTGL